MALYASTNIRGGYQTYCHYKAQAGQVVAIDALTDPAVQSAVTNAVGIIPFPGMNESHNRMPVEGIGESRMHSSALGRRDWSFSVRQQLAAAPLLGYAIRNRVNPALAGTRKGLQYLTFDMGSDTRYGGDVMAEQALDCLINTWSFQAAEGQILQAEMDIWPMVVINQPTPQTRVVAPPNVLIWSNMSMETTSGDLHSLFANVRLGGSNNLQRVGVRKQYGAEGSELAISRTPYGLEPMLEQITLQYQLHDQAPAALRTTADWSTVTLRAEHPVGTAVRYYIQYVIDQQWINRKVRQQAAANQLINYSLEQIGSGVTVTHGTI